LRLANLWLSLAALVALAAGTAGCGSTNGADGGSGGSGGGGSGGGAMDALPDLPRDALPEVGRTEGAGNPAECSDNVDNDGDGMVDCADPDCGGQVCRPAAGPCDVEERCDGITLECPFDIVAPSTTACRPAAGPCDVSDHCDGVAVACPTDAFNPAGTECRPAVGICDLAEACTGSSAACPADALAPATKVCRPVAGGSDSCDAPESCTGTGPSCPVDGFRPMGTVCRPGAGSCDSSAETCPGNSALCPPDVSGCGATEHCDGTMCVAKLGLGSTCTSSAQCTSGFCTDGVCCNIACAGSCEACNRTGVVGTCSPHPTGTDPENACGAYACNGSGMCLTSCSGGCGSNDCKTANYCSGTTCTAKRANSASCTSACECVSGFCTDGVCCDQDCSGPCRHCRYGKCIFVVGETDNEGECGNYYCNGSGACYTACPPGACGGGRLSGTRCKLTAYCNSLGGCADTLAAGSVCTSNCQCKSYKCNSVPLADDVCGR
jgi:hypothetical protein